MTIRYMRDGLRVVRVATVADLTALHHQAADAQRQAYAFKVRVQALKEGLLEDARHRADLAAASAARLAVEGLQTETPGTVSDAALRASQLYMNERVPRSLKQCVAIAAAERLVAWQGIQAYLAGVGARVLWARIAPEAVWYPAPPDGPADSEAATLTPDGDAAGETDG